MRKNRKKLLSLALALCMALALLPTPVLAAGQVYRPQTGAELNALFTYDARLPDGSTVYLEARTYQLTGSLHVYAVNDLSIIGQPGTRLILDTGTDTVLLASDCTNLTLSNLVMGHNKYLTDYAGCLEGVMNLSICSVTMTDCDLFGCGLYGIDASDTAITMDRCTIRDCSKSAAYFSNAKVDAKNCTFSGNGYNKKIRTEAAFYMDNPYYSIDECAVNFTNCTFTNNENNIFYDADDSFIVTTTNCTFSGNGWDKTQQPIQQPANLAYASTQSVTVDGKPVEFQMYALKDASGNDTNYIKLRDMAYILNGTKAQFSVDWDGSISLTTGAAYAANGSEMSTPFSGNRAYKGGQQTLKADGKDVALDAVVLTDDANNGYTYFKLRDLGQLLNFNVTWNNGVIVETDKPYEG